MGLKGRISKTFVCNVEDHDFEGECYGCVFASWLDGYLLDEGKRKEFYRRLRVALWRVNTHNGVFITKESVRPVGEELDMSDP